MNCARTIPGHFLPEKVFKSVITNGRADFGEVFSTLHKLLKGFGHTFTFQ
jgi:hypothetical protein